MTEQELHDDDEQDYLVERPNKTALRKAALERLQLVLALAALPIAARKRLDMPDSAQDALTRISKIDHPKAQMREARHTTREFERWGMDELQEMYDAQQHRDERLRALENPLQQWHARLLEDAGSVTEFLQAYPDAEIQPLRQAIRKAHKQQSAGKPGTAVEALLKHLRGVIRAGL